MFQYSANSCPVEISLFQTFTKKNDMPKKYSLIVANKIISFNHNSDKRRFGVSTGDKIRPKTFGLLVFTF